MIDDIKVLYDIGAFDGDFTRNFLKRNPEAKSFMFEANSKRSLPHDLLDHKWFNVVLGEGKAVPFYYRNGTGDSYYKEIDDTGAYTDSTRYDTLFVTTQKLSSFVESGNIPLPDMIKIDTQGSELDILSGCDEILEHTKYVHCEVPAYGRVYNVGAPSRDEYMEFFSEAGFKHHTVVKDHVKKGVTMQHDIIFLKEEINDTVG